jgi:DUF3102 family protein
MSKPKPNHDSVLPLPVPVSDADRLVVLIAAEHSRVMNAVGRLRVTHGTGINAAICCGQYLVEAKRLVPHGRWTEWLEQHRAVLRFAARQSEKYMTVARQAPAIAETLKRLGLAPASLTLEFVFKLAAKLERAQNSYDRRRALRQVDDNAGAIPPMTPAEEAARLRTLFTTVSSEARDELEAWLLEDPTFQARAAEHPEVRRRARRLDD